MIKRIRYYISPGTDPYTNLATEKLLLEAAAPDECILYLWQNQNTVVIGRNQNAWAECRTALLEQEGGHLARRLSGGGAVFHDTGNLNFTFLVSEENYDLDTQLSVIQAACAALGIRAERSGRNDLLADGHKFSGNAFYHQGGKAYHHGTLLINADMEKLSRYLSPPKAKLEAKGITSVRSRVINLADLCPTVTCEMMGSQMLSAFQSVYGLTAQAVSLTDAELETIRHTATEYSSWEWLFGPKLPFSFECESHYAWGHIQLQLQVVSGTVQQAKVYSDAMDCFLAPVIESALAGCRFRLEALEEALQNAPLPDEIRTDLIKLLQQQSI